MPCPVPSTTVGLWWNTVKRLCAAKLRRASLSSSTRPITSVMPAALCAVLGRFYHLDEPTHVVVVLGGRVGDHHLLLVHRSVTAGLAGLAGLARRTPPPGTPPLHLASQLDALGYPLLEQPDPVTICCSRAWTRVPGDNDELQDRTGDREKVEHLVIAEHPW